MLAIQSQFRPIEVLCFPTLVASLVGICNFLGQAYWNFIQELHLIYSYWNLKLALHLFLVYAFWRDFVHLFLLFHGLSSLDETSRNLHLVTSNLQTTPSWTRNTKYMTRRFFWAIHAYDFLCKCYPLLTSLSLQTFKILSVSYYKCSPWDSKIYWSGTLNTSFF